MIMKGLDLKLANEIRLKLIECAAQSKIICYSDLVPNVLCDNRHMNHLSKILTYISDVVQKDTKIPGIGYFELCAKLNVSTDYKEMQNKCFEFWRKEENRNNFK